jgi:peroxiredoxin Q/BCP
MIEAGMRAPAFTLKTDEGKDLSLDSLKGHRVILFFYPKADTPGCTRESCDFRDEIAAFEKKNAVVLGISKDSVADQAKFRAKYEMPFNLLADTEGKVCEAYGVWVEKTNYGKTYMGIERTTFLIDEDGKIARVYSKVKVEGHAHAVLGDL